MTTLRMIAEDAVLRAGNELSRYAFELTRALIATTPPGCDVDLVFAAHPARALEQYRELFPGAARVHAVSLGREALRAAWLAGAVSSAGRGAMMHAPSLFAPLTKHDRSRGTQQVATIHDTLAWTHPSALGRGEAAWLRRMAHRAARYADAIVVPTHAVADELSELLDVGDRLRVIAGAVSSSLALPRDDVEQRASWLRLPERYLLARGSIEPYYGIDALIDALKLPGLDGLPLLIIGEDEGPSGRISSYAMESGLPEGRVRALGTLTDPDLALVLSRAAAFVAPSRSEGFGLAALEALALGTPLIHSDAPALVEVVGGAGLVVPRDGVGSTYPERLAAAIATVLGDAELADRMRVSGLDRAKAFSWRDSGARVWQLHADL